MLISLLWLIGWRMDNNTRSQYDMRYADIVSGKFSNVDFAIFGASQLVHGINPKYLEEKGLTSYNFAFNGASPEFTYHWFTKIFLQYNQAPKVVLIDVSKSSFDTSYVWRKIEHDSKFFSLNMFMKEMLSAENPYKSKKISFLNRFDVFREKKHPECLFTKKDEADFDNNRFYKGYVPYLLNVACKKDFLPESNEQSRLYFIRQIKEFKSRNCKIIFVASPVFLGDGYNSNLKKFEFVEELAEKHSITYLNYNDSLQSEINLDKSNYADCLHLNDKGSKQFSQRLTADLIHWKATNIK